jgi:predicted transcriptional regulator
MQDNQSLIELTADIVSSHVANNSVAVGDMPNLVQRVYEALSGLGSPVAEAAPESKVPVVSIRASVKPEYLVCMECGRRQKTLRRHLQTAHGMTPEQYRKDYGLPDSYPLTAADYSERRREMAKKIGLGRGGRKPAAAEPAAAERAAPERGRRGRKSPAK